MKSFEGIDGFDWDEGNREKNWEKHKVSREESESLFFNTPILVLSDNNHSQTESRYYAFGKTNAKRFLSIVFTIRKNKIRVISARDMNRKERNFYENQENSEI